MIDPMVIGILIFSIVEGISPLVVFLNQPVEPESSIRRLPGNRLSWIHLAVLTDGQRCRTGTFAACVADYLYQFLAY